MTTPRPRWVRRRLFVICPLICASLLYSTTTALAAHARPSKLISAARLSKHADRVLVRDAKHLKRCLQANLGAPARCAAVHRRLQRAGVRLARAERRLARIARSTSARTGARSASWTRGGHRAPQLWVSGQKLSWSGVGRNDTYLLMRLAPNQAAQYSIVHGTSITPPAAPGEVVRYSVRTIAYGSSWSALRSISYSAATEPGETPKVEPPAPETPKVEPPTKAPKTQAAPQLTLSAQTLAWNVVAGVNTYVLVTKVAGKANQYSAVTGTSFTPPAVAGATVHYSVRTAVEGSAWSAEVSISYPAPPPPPPAEEQPPAESSHFEPGLNSGSDPTYDLPGAEQLGAKVVRLAFNLGETASQIERVVAQYANEGIRVAPMADFDNFIPTPAQAQSLAGWAQAFGPGGTFWAHRSDGRLAMRTIEFGNETSYSYQYTDHTPAGYASRAQSYAQRFAEAANAIRAANPGVGLLAQGDAGNAGAVWVENLFKAVPNLGTLVAGWTIHPYGPGWRTRFQTLISQTAAQGAPATIPIDVTEWGLSSDNGNCVTENYGWGTCMTYQQAADTLTQTANEMRQVLGGRMGMLTLYQIRDQQRPGATNNREAYFGAVQHELQPKGAYTAAVKALLAS
ncbi:MAG TPA: hypothetical protein VFY36_06865 [Solirubrobacteraceae bacterium]|nr:hypothetical protein [Solirubrobacteraceae bacterium]